MPYEKLNLQDGETLRAEHLEHIEDGIAAVEQAVGNGGGGSTLIVTLSADKSTASHTGEQVSEHIRSGGTALLDLGNSYATIVDANDYGVVFASTSPDDGIMYYAVGGYGVERTFLDPMDKRDFNDTIGDISTALDHIIAIQEELIGGDS